MIRTQRIKLMASFDGLPARWHEYFVHREHSFGANLHVACSRLLVCPKCKEVWCLLQFTDEPDCWAVAQYCESCPIKTDWLPVPGSILYEEGWGVVDDSLLRALPPELVKREFKLHLEAYR